MSRVKMMLAIALGVATVGMFPPEANAAPDNAQAVASQNLAVRDALLGSEPAMFAFPDTPGDPFVWGSAWGSSTFAPGAACDTSAPKWEGWRAIRSDTPASLDDCSW